MKRKSRIRFFTTSIYKLPGPKKRRLRTLVVVVLAFTFLFSAVSYANWQDDWISSYSSSGPSYIQGNQRGYYSGGSFSARWPSSNDSLLSVSLPRLKVGCGGIDMFTGGMSFLNVNYLVQKLQNIMSAAPAAAFDLALKTLAPQVSATIKELEAIADRLNGLQLNDCKASKALVATIASPFAPDGSKMQGDLATSMSDFYVSSGAQALYKDVTNLIGTTVSGANGNPPAAGNPVQAASSGMTAGCPTDYLAIYSNGSILANIATIN